jgi:ribosomal protein L37AE/L43A
MPEVVEAVEEQQVNELACPLCRRIGGHEPTCLEVFACGPHCGTKDRYTKHCDGCHARVSHGNVKVITPEELARINSDSTQTKE